MAKKEAKKTEEIVQKAEEAGPDWLRIPWNEQELVVRETAVVTNPFGKEFTLVCEIRRSPAGYLKLACGRDRGGDQGPRTGPIFVDDALSVVDLTIRTMESAREMIKEASIARVRKVAEAEKRRVRRQIASDPNDWRNKLIDLETSLAVSDQEIEDAVK